MNYLEIPNPALYHPNSELTRWFVKHITGTHGVLWINSTRTMILKEKLMIEFMKKFDL